MSHDLKVADRWFEITETGDGIFGITEPYVHAYVRSNAWLVSGSTSHLLVDAGMGVGRLADELASLLDRPVLAVATHAHFDHFGGLAEFGIDWYEEPCLSENIDLVAEVRRAVAIPIVTGEAIYSKEAFFECLAKRAADILNPDICAVGGISAMLDIAAMAQPQAVVMSPHNYNSTLVGLAATVHLSAVIPNFRITEYFVNFQDLCRDIAIASLPVRDGWIDLPTAPGLGIDVDVAKLRAHPHQEATHRGFRQYWDEYPRKGYTPQL